jgi:uncharacterized protein YodC (DUF2158 family)
MWLMANINAHPSSSLVEAKFKIGQNVHLKSGGPEMTVNHCIQAADGKFTVHTIWYDTTVENRRTEARATYPEALLDAEVRPLNKRFTSSY